MPAFKEMTTRGYEIVDYSGSRRRRARQGEWRRVPNRVLVSPALLEHAIRARHGIELWLPEFDELRPRPDTTGNELFDTE
jgi:hypothetical protein